MDKAIDKEQLRHERRRRWLRISLWSAGVIAVLIIAMTSFGGKSVRRSDLNIGTAERGPLVSAVAASGRIVPEFEEIVNSPVASRILAVYVRPGDSVSAGTPLLQLDLQDVETQCRNLRDVHAIKVNQLTQQQLSNRTLLSDLDMQINIKQMEVARMAIEVDNERRIDSLGSGTGDRVRQAETAYATGQLELEGLRRRRINESERLQSLEAATRLEVGNSARDLAAMERTLAQGRIPAPHDGILTYLNSSIGSTVGAGERVAVVGDLSRFRVEAEVPEGSSYKVRAGAAATVRFGNVELEGTVAGIEPQSTSGAVPFSVSLSDASNSRLRPGMRVQVYVDFGYKESVVRIPSGSYFNGPGAYIMFVCDGDSKLRRRTVNLGDSNREWVEVVAGINPGEQVVVSDMKDMEKYPVLKIK